MLTGGGDNTVRIFDVTNASCVRILDGFEGGISAIASCPNGKYVAVADRNNMGDGEKEKEKEEEYGGVKLFDVETGECIGEVGGGRGRIYSSEFSPDGGVLACGGGEGVGLFDVRMDGLVVGVGGHLGGDCDKLLAVRRFYTVNTKVVGLHWTKGNLLMSSGLFGRRGNKK